MNGWDGWKDGRDGMDGMDGMEVGFEYDVFFRWRMAGLGRCLSADRYCWRRKDVMMTVGNVLARLSRISGNGDGRWRRWSATAS